LVANAGRRDAARALRHANPFVGGAEQSAQPTNPVRSSNFIFGTLISKHSAILSKCDGCIDVRVKMG
jgi:hypothetical protein